MPTTPLSLPLDLTAHAQTNRVVDERHPLTSLPERVFVPSAGPFFTEGLQVRNAATGALLQPVTQFYALHLYQEASAQAGKQVCSALYIKDRTVNEVVITYQAIGGEYTDLIPVVINLLNSFTTAGGTGVSWGMVLDRPVKYPPAAHGHDANTLYKLGNLVHVLEGIREAVTHGDTAAIGAIYQWCEQMVDEKIAAALR